MQDIIISIILPVLNEEKRLAKCIESIIAQTEKRWELIIINDGSTDKTVSVIETYMEADDRIRIINNESHLGIIDCLNQGWKSAVSNLICRVDADDYNYPNRLMTQCKFMEKRKDVDLVGSNAIIRIENENKISFEIFMPETDAEIKKVIFKYNPIIHSSVVMRKSFLEKLGGYKSIGYKNIEDYYLWIRGTQRFNYYNLQNSLIQVNRRRSATWKEIFNRSVGHLLIIRQNKVFFSNIVWPILNLGVMVATKLRIYNSYKKHYE